jgi:nitrous oxide reductase accessory protein NosL
MLKIVLLALSLLIMAGCSTAPKPTHKNKVTKVKAPVVKHYKMFQTVPKDKATLLQKGKNKEHCFICGMNLAKFYKTNHVATENGVVHQYCSLHCLTEDLSKGAELENPKVVDVKSLKFIPVQEAYYVVGSKKPATMSRVSKYAFETLEDAKKFQAKNGGKIVDFYSAWQLAKKDFQ